jgi:hypothetical protein
MLILENMESFYATSFVIVFVVEGIVIILINVNIDVDGILA